MTRRACIAKQKRKYEVLRNRKCTFYLNMTLQSGPKWAFLKVANRNLIVSIRSSNQSNREPPSPSWYERSRPVDRVTEPSHIGSCMPSPRSPPPERP